MTLAPTPALQLEEMAAQWSDRPLFILPQAVVDLWQADRTEWSYSQALDTVRNLRAAYDAAGYGPGHRVALLLENRPAHFLHWLALNGLGVSVVPVNPDGTPDEIAYLLNHSGAVLAVALPTRLEQVTGHGIPAIAADDAPPPAPVPADTSSDDPADAECALIYTSGTTGRPKGCILSNRYFMKWGQWYAAQHAPVALRPGAERLMTPLPAFHVNAMGNSFVGMLAVGGAQVIVDRFHPRTWWDMARETGATCFHYLGVMPAILLAIPPDPRDRDHSLRFGMGGGVHPDHHAAFEERFGVPLLEGWAMTETGGACILCAVDEPRRVGTRCLGHPGRPGPEMEIRLVGEDGKPVARGDTGELWVRAAGDDPMHGLFGGYLNDPEATAEVTRDGWLHTGDIMRQDEDGSLHFEDRKKNVIRRSGENIAALEVEGTLNTHPDVAQVAVVATDDPLRGEEVMAVVVLRQQEGAEPRDRLQEADMARALFDHAAETLAYYKVPGWVVFRDSLPVTSTQKVRKADLGGLATNPAADLGAHDLRSEKKALRAADTLQKS